MDSSVAVHVCLHSNKIYCFHQLAFLLKTCVHFVGFMMNTAKLQLEVCLRVRTTELSGALGSKESIALFKHDNNL